MGIISETNKTISIILSAVFRMDFLHGHYIESREFACILWLRKRLVILYTEKVTGYVRVISVATYPTIFFTCVDCGPLDENNLYILSSGFACFLIMGARRHGRRFIMLKLRLNSLCRKYTLSNIFGFLEKTLFYI